MNTLFVLFLCFIGILFLLPLFFLKKPIISIQPSVSRVAIVVPFRNEANRISLLLNSLLKVKNTSTSVYLINDHSTDLSVDIILEFCQTHNLNFVHVLHLPNSLKGKKQALQFAANSITCDWFYFADADTEISTSFISFLQHIPPNSNTHFVQGFPLYYSPKTNFLFHFLYIEFLTLVAFAFISRFYRKPILANAVIMAVKSSSYKEVDLNYTYASGDDIFTLHAIHKNYGINALRFVPIFVNTFSPQNFRESLIQKKRWISKWNFGNFISYVFLLLFVFSGLILGVLNPESFFFYSLSIPVFIGVCIFFLFVFTRKYSSIFYLPIAIAVLPIYLIILPFVLIGIPLEWKSRTI